MNGTNGEPASTPPPDNLESLTPEQLAELASNPEMLGSVRAEVCRRLKDDPHKANFLTFRWFLPADEADQADSFDGLMGCCWEATKRRIFPFGLFPRDGLRGPNRALDGSIVRETREDIKNALVDCLYGLRTLTPPEIVLTVLNGGFHTDADVGNAVRRKLREESKHLVAFGDDTGSVDDEGGYATLFEVLPDDPGPRTNPYNEAVEIILRDKSQIVDELGEEGWEVLEQIVELEDNGLFPQTKRDRQRVLTEIFEIAYSVNSRQARTHKSRFLAVVEVRANEGKRLFEWIEELLDLLGCWDGEKS